MQQEPPNAKSSTRVRAVVFPAEDQTANAPSSSTPSAPPRPRCSHSGADSIRRFQQREIRRRKKRSVVLLSTVLVSAGTIFLFWYNRPSAPAVCQFKNYFDA